MEFGGKMSNKNDIRRFGPPGKTGLYDPQFEHGSCGAGFIAHIKGEKSHRVVTSGLKILENLQHRGAVGSDPKTGDGAGLLVQMPHHFFVRVAGDSGIDLPWEGDYGAGTVFLPTDSRDRNLCMSAFERIVEEEGQIVLGWRKVPTDNSTLGSTSKYVEPVIRQIFIKKGELRATDEWAFERKLYTIRKRIGVEIRASGINQAPYFYIPSLSARTFVYKGLLLAEQVSAFYLDLVDKDFVSALAMVHQRYSTNTFPTWDLAQPFRFLCHNGEINTLRGNINWMHAREKLLKSDLFGDDLKKIFPVAAPGASDSATLDNALELLVMGGRSLPHAMMMLIPEPWDGHKTMEDDRKAFYEYHSCLMEPWDGPASIPFTDGTRIGAVLDRNGLRPSRYTVTKDDLVIMGSESGVLADEPSNVEQKGRLQPGRMFFVDPEQGRIVTGSELKDELTSRKPYRKWLKENLVKMDDLPTPQDEVPGTDTDTLLARQCAYGYSLEDLKVLLLPMATEGKEPIGSMGNDTPLAVLSNQSPLLYSYFKQLFAQVTNPPLDAIREDLVTSMKTTIGSEGNLFDESPEQARLISLDQPILTNEALQQIKEVDRDNLNARVISMLFPVEEGAWSMERRLEEIFFEASKAIGEGVTILVLSDRGMDRDHMSVPSLLVTAGLHHHLVREGTRTRVGLVVETGEAREVQHFCLLAAYGAGAVNPYLAFETLESLSCRRCGSWRSPESHGLPC